MVLSLRAGQPGVVDPPGIDPPGIDPPRSGGEARRGGESRRDVGFRRGWQCYESHIGEVTSKGRPYKDLGSPTPIASFWGVVLPRTYTHYGGQDGLLAFVGR